MGRARSETDAAEARLISLFFSFPFWTATSGRKFRRERLFLFLIFPSFFFDLIPIEVTTLRTISLKTAIMAQERA
jgi:hypothetical protein